MAVPPNLTALTAASLGTLPASVTLDVTDAPTGDGRNEVWYSYTAQGTEIEIGLVAFAADGFNYRPEILVWLGPAAAPTPYLNSGDAFQIDGTKAAIAVPVVAGTTYYFQILNAGPAPPGTPLVLTAATAPVLTTPAGSLLVPDDSDGFNAVSLNPTSGAILHYFSLLANGDWGVVTTAGVMAFDHPAPTYFTLYDAQLNLLRTGYGTAENIAQIATDLDQTFYIAHGASYAVAKTVTAISAAGVIGASWTLPADSIAPVRSFAMAPSRDNTILYYAKARTAGEAIHRYDLINNVPLTDLAAGVAGSLIGQDLLVLADGTLIASYIHQFGPNDNFIRHYAADGTILNTYDFLTNPRNNRLAMAIDDPNSFWSWFYPDGDFGFGATGRYSNIKVSDGTILSATPDLPMYINGVSQVGYTTTVPDLFGPSFSCPFLVLRQALNPVVVGPAACPTGLPLAPGSGTPACATAL